LQFTDHSLKKNQLNFNNIDPQATTLEPVQNQVGGGTTRVSLPERLSIKVTPRYHWAVGLRHVESSGEYLQHVALFTFSVFHFSYI
jgi:hypothetical protein